MNFEWLVVALGSVVVGWLLYKMNQITPGSTTSFRGAKPTVAEKAEPVDAKKIARSTKKPAAKKAKKTSS